MISLKAILGLLVQEWAVLLSAALWATLRVLQKIEKLEGKRVLQVRIGGKEALLVAVDIGELPILQEKGRIQVISEYGTPKTGNRTS
jgi:hypothetical protein